MRRGTTRAGRPNARGRRRTVTGSTRRNVAAPVRPGRPRALMARGVVRARRFQGATPARRARTTVAGPTGACPSMGAAPWGTHVARARSTSTRVRSASTAPPTRELDLQALRIERPAPLTRRPGGHTMIRAVFTSSRSRFPHCQSAHLTLEIPSLHVTRSLCNTDCGPYSFETPWNSSPSGTRIDRAPLWNALRDPAVRSQALGAGMTVD